jgi:hypothetical protein
MEKQSCTNYDFVAFSPVKSYESLRHRTRRRHLDIDTILENISNCMYVITKLCNEQTLD